MSRDEKEMALAKTVKPVLLKAACPVIKESESEHQVASLLLNPSEHRSKVLSWAVDLILSVPAEDEVEERNANPLSQSVMKSAGGGKTVTAAVNLEKACSVLRFPPDFVSGSQRRDDQVKHWRLLARMLEAVKLADHDEATEAWADDFQESLLRRGLANPPPGGDKSRCFNLIPRDLESDVKAASGGNVVSHEQLAQILFNLNQQLEQLEAQKREEEVLPSGGCGEDDVAQQPDSEQHLVLIERLRKSLADFDLVYKTDWRSWMDRVPVVQSSPEFSGVAEEVLDTLQTLDKNAKANQTIRDAVTSIRAMLHQVNSKVNL